MTSFKLNEKEYIFLVTNLLIVKLIFSFPRNAFIFSGSAAWINAIYVSLIALVLLEMSFLTYRFSGKKSILELSYIIGRKPLQIIVCILTVSVLIVNYTTELRTFSESLKIVLLPKTNSDLLFLLLCIGTVIGAGCGLKPLATINAILFPICLVFIGLIFLMLYKSYNINNLFPIFGKGYEGIFIKGTSNLSCFSDLLVINLLMKHCKDISVPKKGGRTAVLIVLLTFLLICISYGLCYTGEKAAEFILPVYQLTRLIKVGEYFQRFEAFFEFVWTITQLLYSSIYLYVIAEVIADTFKLKDYKRILGCTVTIVAYLTFFPESIISALNYSEKLNSYAVPLAFLLPIVIPIIYGISRRDTK